MTIRVVCRSCGSKIDAKDELRGQTRRCPKCRQPILIVPESGAAPASSATKIVPKVVPVPSATTDSADAESTLKVRRMRPDNLYVILGPDREIARWKANEGWFVNAGNGFSAAKRAPERIPDTGEYVLAEGYVAHTDAGRRLKALRFWSLTGRGVLSALLRTETEILEKAKFPTTLSGSQKKFLLKHIRDNYFYEFTDDAPEIVEFLTSFDAHSREIGTFVDD